MAESETTVLVSEVEVGVQADDGDFVGFVGERFGDSEGDGVFAAKG